MLTSDTKRKINAARDILVGKIPMPTAQVEQITLALIYKFMGDMDRRARALGDTSGFFANGYEAYAWDKLMDKSLSARERVKLYGEGLEKMSTNPHIPQLFREIFKGAFLPFNDPETLKLFLDQIDQFSYDHSEELGNAFEYLLSSLGSQGDAGQFRTPRHIIEFIVEAVEPQISDRILDPACGTAGFLIAAFKYLQRQGLSANELKKITEQVVGFDISHDMVRLSLVNLYLHHFPNPHIYEYDSLTSEDRWREQYDCVLANPPFMSPKGGIRPHSRFAIPSNRAEVLFVDYIMEHLSVNGKAGIIVPEGIIFQSQKAYTALRKMMVEDHFLWAVVSLPSGVFQPYSGVKTSILLFDRAIARQRDEVLFVKVEHDGYDLGAQRREVTANDLPAALELLKQYKKDGKLPADDPRVTLVKKTQLAEGGTYNLSGERYRQKEVRTNSAWPMVELGEVFEIMSGGTPSSTNQIYWNGDIKWATLVDIPQHISVITDTKKKITQDGLKNSSAKLLPEGTVMVSTRATIGRIGIAGDQMSTNQGFKNIIIDHKNDSKFIAYVLSHKVDEMEKLASGGTFKEISKTSFSTLKIPLPPLAVQQELVEELDRYQRIIDGARQVVESWTPSFEVDEEWERVELGEVCELTQRGKSPKYSDSGIQVIKSGQARGYFNFDFSKKYFVSHDFPVDHRLLQKGDLLINSTGVGTAGRVTLFELDGQYLVDSHITITRLLPSMANSRYVLYALANYYGFKGIEAMALGAGGQIELSLSTIRSLEIPLPPLAIQQQIVEQIEQERQLVDANKTLIERYTEKIHERINRLWGTGATPWAILDDKKE